MTKTELRIDADFYLYRSVQQNEIELEWGDDLTTISSNFKECLKSFTSTINAFVRQFDTTRDRVTLFISTGDNFRKEVCPDYKGTRQKRKPVGYRRLRDYCRYNYETVELPGIEADDSLGIYCHEAGEDFILISPDKDLKQISCPLYNGKEMRHYTPAEADFFFYQQIISGDPVDGYKGIPGWGMVKAEALLMATPKEEWWPAIEDAYIKSGLTKEDALRNARLARILRPGEYDFDTNTPILWTPPSY